MRNYGIMKNGHTVFNISLHARVRCLMLSQVVTWFPSPCGCEVRFILWRVIYARLVDRALIVFATHDFLPRYIISLLNNRKKHVCIHISVSSFGILRG